MTTAFWLATAQTTVFLALCGWAFWITGRVAELLNAADSTKEHSEAGAQHANRAAIDARHMLEEIRVWLDDVRDWLENPPEDSKSGPSVGTTNAQVTPEEPQPQTEPMKRVSPDTVPQVEAITAAPDEWVAQQMAQIMARVEKPRTGSTASRHVARPETAPEQVRGVQVPGTADQGSGRADGALRGPQ